MSSFMRVNIKLKVTISARQQSSFLVRNYPYITSAKRWGGGQMLMIADNTSPTYELLALFTNAQKNRRMGFKKSDVISIQGGYEETLKFTDKVGGWGPKRPKAC